MEKKGATIITLAQKLNLSKGTISRILNGDSSAFAEETCNRVRMMADEMGYVPNPLARALAIRHAGSIALWLRNLHSSFFASIIEETERLLGIDDYRMMIRMYQRDLDLNSNLPPALPDSVDGVISVDVAPHMWIKCAKAMGSRMPIVFIGDHCPDECPDFVGMHLEKASREAVEYLVSSGRKRIAYFSPDLNDMRKVAYEKVMTEHGRSIEFINSGDFRTERFQRFQDYVNQKGYPDAIFCHDDDTAVAVYLILKKKGIKVPDDVALIGCHGLMESEYLSPTLSTIETPVDEMVSFAWKFLKQRMEDPDCDDQNVNIDAKFILRGSC
jgi:LacI family transcriptional regulator